MSDGTNAAISEAASKKRKRGRPRIYSKETLAIIQGLEPDITTERGVIEQLLVARAYSPIQNRYDQAPEENQWALHYIDLKNGRVFHKGILSQIARTDDTDEGIVNLARTIAEKKIPDKDAITQLRRYRLGREPKSNYLQLYIHLEKSLNNYIATHPNTPRSWMVRALGELAEACEECLAEDTQATPRNGAR